MVLGESLTSTPTWAVATVTSVLIVLSLLIEHSLHLLTKFVDKRKRKSLKQAVEQVKGELRNFGFISLLLTMAQQPISKICISASLANTFLPCQEKPSLLAVAGDDTCTKKGKVSLMSSDGSQQLQVLMFLLAVFHVGSSVLTLGLEEIKMKNWGSWEEQTKTLEHQLSNDPRRFKFTKQTSFGRRHLKFWSKHTPLLWIVCFARQFHGSVSRADYLALRNGFIDAHLGSNSAYNFHKFLRRSLDKDFKDLVIISPAIWMYVIVYIFFNAHVFYSHYWLPFMPVVVLLALGTKLEMIITKMCLKSSRQSIIVSGEVNVNPNDKLFWFGRPRLLLHAIHLILIQNSFQLAFMTWSSYKYGFHSCFHKETQDFAFNIGVSIIVQFLCAYVTLPLYSLVNQMGSSMKETIFVDRVVAGIKNWHSMAKRSLSSRDKEFNSCPSSSPSATLSSPATLNPIPSARAGSSRWTHQSPWGSPPGPSWSPVPFLRAGGRSLSPLASSSSSPLSRNATARFDFPAGRRELMEIQKVTEEMMGQSTRGSFEGGEMSFRVWWTQEMISPARNGRMTRIAP